MTRDMKGGQQQECRQKKEEDLGPGDINTQLLVREYASKEENLAESRESHRLLAQKSVFQGRSGH